MLKNRLRVLIHKLLLPRGREYKHQTELEDGWDKYFILSGKKSICVLQKDVQGLSNGIVILSHPYLAEAKAFYLLRDHAEMYLTQGFGVVMFDFNGFGESPFVDFDYASDLSAVADYIRQKMPEIPIFGHGVSFGASHTITYGTRPDNVFHKIIIENCLDNNLSYYKKRNSKLYLLMRGLMKVFPSVNKDHNYVHTINRLKNINSALFIYNTGDDLTTIQMGEQLHASCNIHASILIFKGQHLQAFQKNKNKYTEDVISFLLRG